MAKLSTLCYIEQNGKYLMLHRTVKKNDVNKEKWIGVGGHFEADESPEECLLREVREETGYTSHLLASIGGLSLLSPVTASPNTCPSSPPTALKAVPIPCDEGELAWVKIQDVEQLNIWEGDKIFFRLLRENRPFFSLKLVYDGHGGLVFARSGRPANET